METEGRASAWRGAARPAHRSPTPDATWRWDRTSRGGITASDLPGQAAALWPGITFETGLGPWACWGGGGSHSHTSLKTHGQDVRPARELDTEVMLKQHSPGSRWRQCCHSHPGHFSMCVPPGTRCRVHGCVSEPGGHHPTAGLDGGVDHCAHSGGRSALSVTRWALWEVPEASPTLIFPFC